MWAPADVYGPWFSAVTLSLTNITTFFFRNPLVFVVVMVALIGGLTLLGKLLTRTDKADGSR